MTFFHIQLTQLFFTNLWVAESEINILAVENLEIQQIDYQSSKNDYEPRHFEQQTNFCFQMIPKAYRTGEKIPHFSPHGNSVNVTSQ